MLINIGGEMVPLVTLVLNIGFTKNDSHTHWLRMVAEEPNSEALTISN